MKAFKIRRGYKHLLRYNQSCFDGIEYGFTDLYYEISGSTLFIKKVDHHKQSDYKRNQARRLRLKLITPLIQQRNSNLLRNMNEITI